jgi:hypothetical protein
MSFVKKYVAGFLESHLNAVPVGMPKPLEISLNSWRDFLPRTKTSSGERTGWFFGSTIQQTDEVSIFQTDDAKMPNA